MRITALHTARGQVFECADFRRHSTDLWRKTSNHTPKFILGLEEQFADLLRSHPDILEKNSAIHHTCRQSSVEWLLELIKTQKPQEDWSDLSLIVLAHSTLDRNIFHSPAARIKYELSARKSMPFAVGQSQTNAFFHALRLLLAWQEDNAESRSRVLLGAVEKRRFPLLPHMSVGIPISDAVGFAIFSFTDGPGLSLHSVCVEPALTTVETEGFETLLDHGHDAHAHTLAESLWRLCKTQQGTVLCAGPNFCDGIAAQIWQKLLKLSSGKILQTPPAEHFFMAADPLLALERAEAHNKDFLPILLWSLDDRLALGAALFYNKLQNAAA